MKSKVFSLLALALVFTLTMALMPTPSRAEADTATAPASTQDPGFFSVLGSVLLSTLYLPTKLVTCVGTQAVTAVGYVGTFGVAGNYDGKTHGPEMGEVARRSCTGPWVVTPSQVANDYGE